jgi:NADH-quinone oxidoreductase subunit E
LIGGSVFLFDVFADRLQTCSPANRGVDESGSLWSFMSAIHFSAETTAECKNDRSQVIPLLQMAQAQCGYVAEDAIAIIAEITGVSESEVVGVVTFYKQFRLAPPGKHLIRVCDGTACHVMGATMLLDIVHDELKLEGSDTSRDGLFTLTPVACLGCCSLAPVMMVDSETYGGVNSQKVRKILREYRRANAAKAAETSP